MIFFSLPSYEYLARPLLKLSGARRGRFSVSRFPNQELFISLKTRVHGKKCVVLGGTAPPDSELLTTLLLCHTLKKEGAREIAAVIPYLGYSRQDKDKVGKSWGSKWVGEMLYACGVNNVITVDVHSESVRAHFPVPLLSLQSSTLFAKALSRKRFDDIAFVAPDEGAIDNCESLLKALGIRKKISYLKKKRTVKGLKFSTLHGKVAPEVVMADDILDTGETLVSACKKLRQAGAREITIVVTHGQFTGVGWKRLWSLGVTRVYCTDSVPRPAQRASKRITVLSIAPLIARALL